MQPLKIKVREEYLIDIGDDFSSFLDHISCQCCQMCDYTSVVPSESRLHAQEDIRGPLSELQQLVLPEIQDQIQDYRYSEEIKVLRWDSGRVECLVTMCRKKSRLMIL